MQNSRNRIPIQNTQSSNVVSDAFRWGDRRAIGGRRPSDVDSEQPTSRNARRLVKKAGVRESSK